MVINLKNTVYTTVHANNKQLNQAEKLVFVDENWINLSKIIALLSDSSKEKGRNKIISYLWIIIPFWETANWNSPPNPPCHLLLT